VRQFAKIAAVQTIVFLCGLIAIECALAWFAPLPPHGGVYTERDGSPARVAFDDIELRPNLDLIHAASEFSASIHTNALGYRRMSRESRTPDVLFLGDSFTFGHGVSDNEVFPEVFCKARGLTCLNLGRSGTDTFDQVRILRHGIDAYQLRPKTVMLAMLAACWLGVAGNDLGDNLTHARSEVRGAAPLLARADLTPSLGDIVKAIQRRVVDFEITKRVMIIATSGLKTSLYSCSPQAELEAAQRATAVALRQLARLADEFGFQAGIVVIHPYQELDGAYRSTEAIVAGATPEKFTCVGTGARFRKSDYYAYDGHFNPSGHAKLASILESTLTPGKVVPANAGCRSAS
jgi:lysophospholipase L1-like esterase